MTITNLKASPQYYKATLQLIEKAFQYQPPNRFEKDFAPLMSENNRDHCFIKVMGEKVVAHIGACKRKILGVHVAMLGGIAVDEAHRGEGHFQELMQEVMSELRSDVASFMLWSDQKQLYKRYGFHLCGHQFEITQNGRPENFEKTKLHALNNEEVSQLHKLYQQSFSKFYTTTERTLTDWNALARISSADLFLRRKDGLVTDYFFMNKGQDLSEVIYEYGSLLPLKEIVNSIKSFGKIWTAIDVEQSAESQYQFFLAPSDKRLFHDLVLAYTKGQINVHEINPVKEEVFFYFNEELLLLSTEEFLRGIFGPAPFEELGDLTPIFISGLESI